jgi:hypothetical protein
MSSRVATRRGRSAEVRKEKFVKTSSVERESFVYLMIYATGPYEPKHAEAG